MALFRDRREAGRKLAGRLAYYGPDTLVLALPRGGVPVGFEVAKALHAPLDVFVVRKLGVPGYDELAMGAIASGGVTVMNDDVLQGMRIPESAVRSVAEKELKELERREKLFRGDRQPPVIEGRTVILVDDGLATGASMRAAVHALRKLSPDKLVVAVPVAAPETCDALRSEVDELVCAETPQPFLGVGRWYASFPQTTDAEVRTLLEQAARGSAPVT